MKSSLLLALVMLSFQISMGTAHALSIVSQTSTIKSTTTKVRMDVEVPQTGTSALDILFVIDDSGSMSEHQAKLAANVGELVRAAKSSGVDLHAAVITTNMDAQPYNPKSGVAWKGIFAGAGKKVAATSEGDFDQVLTSNLQAAMTTDGSGTEQPFLAIKTALSEPLLSTTNAGFLREKAALAILVLTDADDQSAGLVSDFITFLKDTKKLAPVTLHAAYIPSAEVMTSTCRRSSEPVPVRIEEALKSLGTTTESASLCDPNFGKQLQKIGDGFESLGLRTVQLKLAPELSTVVVTYGSDTVPMGDLTFGWVYDAAKNEILFGDKINWLAQPAATKVVIEYTAAN